ncbi:hypothetical protein [Butyrivibrio proteoclasticus]|uniref:hypothetical protein n=1 Tax=Butyrivibrio proteoclasticus TaxID=43305 RepID=UPI00047E9E87|nr:hypothetical protein [Butyrivibrio proteoclasticus]
MYINRKTHYLSTALFWAAGIHVFSNAILGTVRYLVGKSETLSSIGPQMTNTVNIGAQMAVSAMQVICMTVVFISAFDKLKKSLSVISESDRLQMAVLQQEVLGKGLPTLTGDSIGKLLELWGIILIGVRMVYDICSIVYRKFVMDLVSMSSAVSGAARSAVVTTNSFVEIYNNTHGFKYIGLLVAILLGIMTTGIFLNDKILKFITMILMAFFLLSFVLLGMQTFNLGGYSVGIVWTSVIFHLVETLGLLGLGIYLRKKYVGL